MATPWKLYVGLGLLLFAVLLLTWRGATLAPPVPEGFSGAAPTQADVDEITAKVVAQSKVLDGIVIPKLAPISTVLKGVAPAQHYLINLAPITITYAGYIGAGVFDASTFFKHAFALGIRSFVLPISKYKDDNKKPPIWPNSGEPALVYRDAQGNITSSNGLTIAQLTRGLVNSLGAASVQQSEPIMIKIEAVPGADRDNKPYVPDPDGDERTYVDFMTKIADGLKPLRDANLLLTQLGQYGSPLGATQQDKILLQTPVNTLAGKVLITTDFDVSKYYKKAYLGTKGSLLEYVHFVVSNSPQQGKMSYYKTLPLTNISSTTDPDASRITLNEVKGTTIEDTASVALALRKGVQILPLPLFESSAKPELVLELIKPWKGAAWALKPEEARYTKPAPVKAATPSQSMNARVVADAQPGQIVVGK